MCVCVYCGVGYVDSGEYKIQLQEEYICGVSEVMSGRQLYTCLLVCTWRRGWHITVCGVAWAGQGYMKLHAGCVQGHVCTCACVCVCVLGEGWK